MRGFCCQVVLAFLHYRGKLTCAVLDVEGQLLGGPGGVGVDPVGWWERNVADCHGKTVLKRFAAVKRGTQDSLTVILHIHGRLILEVLPDA